MAHHDLSCPVTEAQVRALRVNDTVTLNGTLYATDDAVCIRSGRMLSCGTCACGDTGLLPAALSSSDTPVDVTCTFRKTETGINVSC